MQTDVTLSSLGQKIVIEVKYPADLFQTAYGGKPKLHSSHLYQLLSYLKTLRPEGVPIEPPRECCSTRPLVRASTFATRWPVMTCSCVLSI